MTSFHQRFLGKIYSVTFCLSAEDLSEENVAYMRTLRFPFLDFLVSSVQFSVNSGQRHPISFAFQARFLGHFPIRPVSRSSSPYGSILGQVRK